MCASGFGDDTAAFGATGHGHTANQIMSDQCVRLVMVNGENRKEVLRKACRFKNLAQKHPATGAIGGMFQQDSIARHQICDCITHGLIRREIPWLNSIDHTRRSIGDDALTAILQRTVLVCQNLRPIGSGPFANANTEIDFIATVAQELADLICHQLCELFLAVVQSLANPYDNLCPLLNGRQAPLIKSCMTRL